MKPKLPVRLVAGGALLALIAVCANQFSHPKTAGPRHRPAGGADRHSIESGPRAPAFSSDRTAGSAAPVAATFSQVLSTSVVAPAASTGQRYTEPSADRSAAYADGRLNPTSVVTFPTVPAEPLTLPLAMVTPPDAIRSDRAQLAQLVSLGQQFLAATDNSASASVDNSPAAIRHSWQQAVSSSDEQFKLLYGWSAFSSQQLQRAIEALNPPQPPP